MKLKEIHRTSTFAWSPLPSIPLLATGTVAGALDESFSNDSQLEIWAPNFLNKQEYDLGGEAQPGPTGVVNTGARFNRIAWGYMDGGRPQGVIAAGMENGELGIWDPEKIVAKADPLESLIFKNNTHTGPIRGLDFNPIQTSLFSSGGINGEIYIWDLKDPSKPYSPGTRSAKLDDITALSWNNQVPHVLATSSSTGYTVVWDLRGKREVVALAYGGGAGTLAGTMQGGPLGMGGRRGMSDVAWHPDNATRLVTSSEDDASPVIMVWDLRNARAPEKILTGHEKGVLSLSWCKQDADLLLSSGKDNRALCWNPQTSEIIGELPSADNWAFQVQWCPRNPDLLATAFFDGTIGIHSIQSTNETAQTDLPAMTPKADGADVFDVPGFSRTTQGTLSLKQPPKWLRRPVSSSFGYGGKLVTVSNLQNAHGRHQSGVVHLRKVITEETIVERAERLREALEKQELPALAAERSKEAEANADEAVASWRALLSLFRADSRDELVTLLGFSKIEIAARVAAAVEKLKAVAPPPTQPKSLIDEEEDLSEMKPRDPIVSFAEPELVPEPEQDVENVENTPSEVSASNASDTTNITPLADGESTTTAPSLFGDENVGGTPQMDAAADFFSTMGMSQSATANEPVVPHTNYGLDSSVAATIGSGPSSVASEMLKDNTFRIYPADESETDALVTKALVVGDFESAVALCLSSDRFADAILLAVKGGPELLARTQKTYFERCTTTLPYLRLFQSIVTNDLEDIVQNADLQEWQEIFVVLCTFASQQEFAGLAEQLGSRLEFQSNVAKASGDLEKARESRKNATLTYLAAGRLERLINIWIEELAEEEKRFIEDGNQPHVSRYTAHAQALQTFIEKVTVFRAATRYVDSDLENRAPEDDIDNIGTYKLASLYDRYFEYADLLATQGLVKEAVSYLKLIPQSYQGTPGSTLDISIGRERILVAAGAASAPAAKVSVGAAAPAVSAIPAGPAAVPVAASASYSYSAQYAASVQQHAIAPSFQPPSAYDAYAPAGAAAPSTAYAPAQPAAAQTYQPSAPTGYPSGGYQPSPSNVPPPGVSSFAPPPPRQFSNGSGPTPPPKRRTENGGWNDAPALAERRTPSSMGQKLNAITSPFPNASPAPAGSPPLMRGQSPATVPPPPRPGSVQARAPPPPQGQRMAPPPHGGPGLYPPQGRSQSIPPGMMGPGQVPQPGQQMPARQPPPGQYAPTQRGHVAAPAPPGPYNRATPPPGAGPPPPGPGPYARATPPPGAHPPPPGFARGPPPPGFGGPSQQMQPPPPQGVPRVGPPPGAGPPPSGAPRAPAGPPPRAGPAPPKYPPGDRSHIPDSLRPAYNVISGQLGQLKQITPPQQKRLIDDLERRIGPLFDALNCETLSQPVVEQLIVLTKAMENHDRESALAIHVDMLTRSVGSDDIALWMSGVKQLIMRL